MIHPRQVETVNALFAPTPDEIEAAGRPVAALTRAARNGPGAITVDGRMVDEAVAVAARRTLARSRARP